MPMISDYDELFERFAIMTIDGGLSDRDALEYLRSRTTKELLIKLVRGIK